MHIAIVGNIGSGKTTLTELLSKHYNATPSYESVENNPYLEDFYNDMQRWSFNVQIFFLNSRFLQLLEVKKNHNFIIQDRTMYEDAYIFANSLHDMSLMSSRDYNNYLGIFNSLKSFIKAPDLLIYLKGSVPTLVNHIKTRGRHYESEISTDYLSKLNIKYNNWIDNYKEGKLLTIDIDQTNFVDNKEDLDKVIALIDKKLQKEFSSLKK